MRRSLFACLLLVPCAAFAQDVHAPDEGRLSERYPGKAYSPYANRGFPSRPYWGDTHLHTGYSLDAGAFGCRLKPEDAYRFARGDEVQASSGQPVRLSRPLDWLVVADHSDQMGFMLDLLEGKPHLLATAKGKEWFKLIKEGKGAKAAYEIVQCIATQTFPKEIGKYYLPSGSAYKSVWQRTIDAAEKYNEPRRFTAFIGYEWTSNPKGNNLHRVVIFRDGAEKARQVVPFTVFEPEGSTDPRDLWRWLTNYEKTTGGDVLAIAHNGNVSNGTMFPLDVQYNGVKLDKAYAQERAKWEPIYEVTQIKGDGEAHPLLSPNDEFADYESWDIGNMQVPTPDPKQDGMLAGEYAREALKRGFVLEERYGTNPYQFGLIGSTDSHTGLATAQEDNFFGKHSACEPSPKRMGHDFMKNAKGVIEGWEQVASGLAAVWAVDNTREALFDAMERKETYATTGSRMAVRFFGGWDYTERDLQSRSPAFAGYSKGVPMGGNLPKQAGKAPTFMVYALRDPIGANLDRIQIVKGWRDAQGKTHERVYDVVWSGDRKPGADGKLPPVGNTVDAKTAHFTNTIGSSELATLWTDPEFDPKLSAFYYARVLEIPTPRWSTIEAYRYGLEIPKGAPVSTQERAYTSPIWYAPR